MAMAPIYAGDPKCPTIATSMSPNRGTVILEIIEGMAIRSIFLSAEYGLSIVMMLSLSQCCRAAKILILLKMLKNT